MSQSQLSQDGKTKVQTADKLFAANDLTIKPTFTKAMELFYKSSVQNVDFKNAAVTLFKLNHF